MLLLQAIEEHGKYTNCTSELNPASLHKELRKYVVPVLRDLANRKVCKIEEGHLMSDHIHILILIPPKYSVSQVIGFDKGKSAISIARNYMARRRNFT
jgi:putative transposase